MATPTPIARAEAILEREAGELKRTNRCKQSGQKAETVFRAPGGETMRLRTKRSSRQKPKHSAAPPSISGLARLSVPAPQSPTLGKVYSDVFDGGTWIVQQLHPPTKAVPG